jgi:hypothetical protein
MRGVFTMKDRKQPHEKFTKKDNGLSSMQEVIYPKEFKRADEESFKKNPTKK